MRAVPLHVSCEVRLPATGAAASPDSGERFFRLTEAASPDEITFYWPLPLEPGRRVELSLEIPGDGPMQVPAVLLPADPDEGETVRIASLRRADASRADRERLLRYARRREEGSLPGQVAVPQ